MQSPETDMEPEQVLQAREAEEVQSPFLPGTNIQFAWDSTSLELLKRCARLYWYVMIEGWAPKGEGIHLRFGRECHQGFHDYELYKSVGLTHDEAVHATIKELLVRMGDWDPDPQTPSEEKKSKRNLVRVLVWYLDQFRDDGAKTIKINGEPAIEVSFRFELDWGPMDLVNGDGSEEKGQPYLLCGHLDRIVKYQGDLFVMDRKTSVFQLGSYYFNQFHPNNQMSLYTIAGKVVLDSPIRGVIIDAMHIEDEQPSFARGITYRTQDQMNEWLNDLHFWFALAEDYAAEGYWPMNDTACDKYGGCKFRDVCQKSPAAREIFLKSDFIQLAPEERWNPLKPR